MSFVTVKGERMNEEEQLAVVFGGVRELDVKRLQKRHHVFTKYVVLDRVPDLLADTERQVSQEQDQDEPFLRDAAKPEYRLDPDDEVIARFSQQLLRRLPKQQWKNVALMIYPSEFSDDESRGLNELMIICVEKLVGRTVEPIHWHPEGWFETAKGTRL